MSEYLSKEEIKQWRSSLEKITLEEYAARLGKKLEAEKHTNDVVDMVLKGKPVMSFVDESFQPRAERISSIAERAFEREKQISHTPFNVHSVEHKVEQKPAKKETLKPVLTSDEKLREDVQIAFKKALTDREQMVFDYFAEHNNEIVYAKDLATLLELPRDYVYKYIKNLRAKIDGENLQNAENGGFILSV